MERYGRVKIRYFQLIKHSMTLSGCRYYPQISPHPASSSLATLSNPGRLLYLIQ
jgi:hypothetical protein